MIKLFSNNARIIKMNPLNKNNLDVNKGIKDTLDKLLKRAEYELSDDFHYKDINECFSNDGKGLNCKALAFTISQDSDKFAGHMLEVSMLHKSMQRELTRPLAYGTKKDILDFLKNKESFKSIKKDIDEMNKEILED